MQGLPLEPELVDSLAVVVAASSVQLVLHSMFRSQVVALAQFVLRKDSNNSAEVVFLELHSELKVIWIDQHRIKG